jgi:hypothetical protein
VLVSNLRLSVGLGSDNFDSALGKIWILGDNAGFIYGKLLSVDQGGHYKTKPTIRYRATFG